MSEEIFLLSLVTIAGQQRGRRFILKEEEALGMIDKWLCLLAGVEPEKLKYGLLTTKPGEETQNGGPESERASHIRRELGRRSDVSVPR